MHSRKITFKWVYLIWFIILTILVIAAVLHVRSLLNTYEAAQPETHVRNVIDELTADAANGTLWGRYTIPETAPGKFESSDLREKYLGYYTDGEVSFTKMWGQHEEDELYYEVKNGDFTLAEIKLRAVGEPVTKLAIFNYREWVVDEVRPILKAHDYILTLPDGFTVKVNGTTVPESEGTPEGENERNYIFSGIYLEPDFEIADREGNKAAYTVKDNRVIPEIYNYSLTLPAALTVSLNGEVHRGERVNDKLVRHTIVLLAKPEVKISDHYGNVVDYEGGDRLPLTYAEIAATDRHTVTVEGNAVPEGDVSVEDNPDYSALTEFVTGLPGISIYDIAILKENAEIAVRDSRGNLASLEPGETYYDFTSLIGLEAVPESISAEVDVLKIAQQWSLLMSRDLNFSIFKPYLIKGSYQYEVASKYVTGIDITFTSKHTLMDPPFTEEKVTNFIWITDDCFSVDISFVKHMHLTTRGMVVDDAMNDRFYFVKYDDTDDRVDNPAWKLVSMKEIINGTGTEN